MVKKIIFIFVGLASFSFSEWFPNALDQLPGSSSFALLKIDQSAPTQGLAGGGVSLLDEKGNTGSTNPASAYTLGTGITFGQVYPSAQTQSRVNQLNWYFHLYKQKFTAQIAHLGFDDLDGYDVYNKKTLDYGAQSMKIGLGWSGKLGQTYFGVHWKNVLNQIEIQEYYASTLDFGAIHALPYGFQLGAAVQSFGIYSYATQGTHPEGLAATAQNVPITSRLGLSWTKKWSPLHRAQFFMDARTFNDESITLPVGAEYVFKEILRIRLGKRFRSEELMSIGFGAGWESVYFNYGIGFQEELDAFHNWSLGVFF